MKTIQRIRRSHAQWREIFLQFEANSLSAAAFCKQQGICCLSVNFTGHFSKYFGVEGI